MENKILWQSKPSQVLNLHFYLYAIGAVIFLLLWKLGIANQFFQLPASMDHYVLYVLSAFTLLMITAAAWRWLDVQCQTYTLTEEVFRYQYGVLNRVTHELELYRVRDSTSFQPFFLRLFGLGSIRVDTTDSSTPYVFIQAIENTDKVRQLIRAHVEIMRKKRGIVEVGNY